MSTHRTFLRTLTGITAAGVLVGGLTSSKLVAANQTASLTVNASVANNCTISTTAVAFGAYDPVTANATVDATANGHVFVACTKGAAATVDLGNGGAADPNSRKLASGANSLNYQLYKSDATTVWSAGAGGVTYSSTSKTQTDLVVVGKVPGGQDIPAGTYTNTIVATVNF